jgi:hypothetical protein
MTADFVHPADAGADVTIMVLSIHAYCFAGAAGAGRRNVIR